MLLDEDVEFHLLYRLNMIWAGEENDKKAINRFKFECIGQDIPEEELTRLIQTKYPWYGQNEPAPEPVAETPDPTPTGRDLQNPEWRKNDSGAF
jgi:hypothetical protein